MDQRRQHVSVLCVEVVVRPEDVGGDHCGVAPAMLLEVAPAPKDKVDR